MFFDEKYFQTIRELLVDTLVEIAFEIFLCKSSAR